MGFRDIIADMGNDYFFLYSNLHIIRAFATCLAVSLPDLVYLEIVAIMD